VERVSRLTALLRRGTLFGLALAAIVTLFGVWQLNHLGGDRWDWDEGVYLLTAREVAQGYHLYSDVFSTAPPLFIQSLDAGFAVAGDNTAAGRGVIVFYGILALVAVGLIARELGGPVAGVAAATLLAIAPHFLLLSRLVIADVPSVAVSCLALWAALRYERGGRRA
jgi:4-amino-4-deoxy-L-arabinose transferase-like glycosyltransferase